MSPCQTFAGAILKTAAGGEINCLDSGGFGSVTITQSVTIDCQGNLGSIAANSGSNGVTINGSGIIVRLRNLDIFGSADSTFTNGGLVGVRITAASQVTIEGLSISGMTKQGILDERATAAILVIKDSSITNVGGTGFVAMPSPQAQFPAVQVVMDNVLSTQNLYGVAVGINNVVSITRSTFSKNRSAGVEADYGAKVVVKDSTIAYNLYGLTLSGSGGIAISNSSLLYNTTAVLGASPFSYGNNLVVGNTYAGTAFTPAGSASSAVGLQ